MKFLSSKDRYKQQIWKVKGQEKGWRLRDATDLPWRASTCTRRRKWWVALGWLVTTVSAVRCVETRFEEEGRSVVFGIVLRRQTSCTSPQRRPRVHNRDTRTMAPVNYNTMVVSAAVIWDLKITINWVTIVNCRWWMWIFMVATSWRKLGKVLRESCYWVKTTVIVLRETSLCKQQSLASSLHSDWTGRERPETQQKNVINEAALFSRPSTKVGQGTYFSIKQINM